MTKEVEDQILRYEKHCENTSQIIKYSIERFDVLIISLSSGGIVLLINFSSTFLHNNYSQYFTQLKISITLFGIALIINLFSQVTSYIANKCEIKIVKNIIRLKKNKVIIGNQNSLEFKKKIFNGATTALNAICLISLIIAILLVITIMYN